MAKLLRSCAGLAVGLSWCPHLAAAGLIALLAVLGVAPTLRLNAVWGAWGAEGALIGAAISPAAMLVVAAVLAAADWLTENANRRAWVAAGAAPAVPVVSELEHSEDSYAPAASDKALWALFRTHRRAACPSSLCAAGKASPKASLRTNAAQPKRTEAISVVGDPVASGIARGANAGEVALRAGAAQDRPWKAVHAQASIRLAHQSKRRWHLGARAATRMRLVANSRPCGAWSDFDQPPVSERLPIKIVSNIIVLGQGNNRSTDGERPPSAELGGDTSIAGSNGRQQTRLRTFHPEISFEAKRQLIALAEALARQAAREDETVERLAERSRSPPDAPAENPLGLGEKEDAG